MEHEFIAMNVRSGYEKNKDILKDITIEIPIGRISVIIGSNACGKSTLLKTMGRLLILRQGSVSLDEKSIEKYKSKELAKTLGFLPQSPLVPEGVKVSDLVGRGRYPYQNVLGTWKKSDYEAVARALEVMNLSSIASRSIDELSGGQKQRVRIAMALAQETEILFLDEPTTYLDISHQVEILDTLTELNKERGITIVMVLHDINLVSRYADYIFAMKDGKLFTEGKPSEIINEKMIFDVFNLHSKVIKDPVSGTPLVVPIGKEKLV
jgi:iron complex transport system ATP-binding protein